MITINLLPISAYKAKYKGRVFLIGYALLLVIGLVALFSFKTNIMDSKIDFLNKAQSQMRSQLDQAKKDVAEADKATADTFKLWQRLAAVLELEERRRDQTRLLVELESLLPKENAWFLSLKHDKGVMTLEGISTDKETVSQFLTRLENAKYIERRSVNLLEIAQNLVINDIKLTRFKVNARTTFPQPTVMETGLPELGLPSRSEFLKLVEAAAPKLVEDLKKDGKVL